MEDPTTVLQKIKAYADSSAKLEQERANLPISESNQKEYEAQLDRTINILQDQVKKHEVALQKLRDSNSHTTSFQPSSDPPERLKQIQTINSAYESLAQSEPSFPPPESPLPALVALRDAHRKLTSSKASIKIQKDKLNEKLKRLEHENLELRDARLITDALEKRIERLRGEGVPEKSSREVAEDFIKEEQKRGKNMEKDIKKLTKALTRFINNDLAAMLAAEDLGGPTTGDVLEVDDGVLDAGYTQQGKPRKSKITNLSGEGGVQMTVRTKTGNGENGQGKKEIAAAEMRALLEKLLAAVSDLNGSSAYVDLDQESAASRFLVRAKVAQFHPMDAQRIRLVEFGRDLDD